MNAVAIDTLLLRTLLPDTRLMPGRVLTVRVATNTATGKGSISLAGVLVDATLPKDVKAGDKLRLFVREATDQRIVLSPANAAQQAAIAPMHSEAQRELDRDPGDDSDEGSDANELDAAIALRWQGRSIGPVDLRFSSTGELLSISVKVSAGATHEAASASAATLQQTITQSIGKPVIVNVLAHPELPNIYV